MESTKKIEWSEYLNKEYRVVLDNDMFFFQSLSGDENDEWVSVYERPEELLRYILTEILGIECERV